MELLQLQALYHYQPHWPGPAVQHLSIQSSSAGLSARIQTPPSWVSFTIVCVRGFVSISIIMMQALTSQKNNHSSTLANSRVVSSHIINEISASRLVGPLLAKAASLVHTSPIGQVSEGHTMGRWCVIVDLSFLTGHSVNDGVNRNLPLSNMLHSTIRSSSSYILSPVHN